MARSSKQERRRYDNRLREEQAETTRERILEAVVELFAAGEVADFSVGKVAKIAGVSEPTIYRHFKSRDGLIDAFGPWLESRRSHPGFPDALDRVVEKVPAVAEYFENNAELIRASLAYDSHDLVNRGRRSRRERMVRMVEPLTRHLPKAEARARQAAVAEAVTARNYFILRDECGLSPEEAGRAIQWAVKTLIAELQRDQPQ